MNYILCEDSGAGKEFFDIVVGIYIPKSDYIVVTAKGNLGLRRELDKIKSNFKSGDSLLVAYDDVKQENGFDPGQFVKHAENICSGLGVELWVTSYYCFEEIYLAYSELYNMLKLNPKNKKLADILKYTMQGIKSEKDYYTANIQQVQQLARITGKEQTNYEHYCKEVLSLASHAIGRSFWISGGTLGKCWLGNCDVIKISKHVCSRCTFCMKGTTRKEKYEDLRSKTIKIVTRRL